MRERFEIKFDEKAKLVVYKWTNSNVKTIGCVQIAHGLSEHVTRYDAFANFLADHGFTVLAEDHYQHGESAEDLEPWARRVLNWFVRNGMHVLLEHAFYFHIVWVLFPHSRISNNIQMILIK